MRIKWPWKSSTRPEALVVACNADRFAYVQAGADGALRRCGVEHRGTDSAADFARRLRALNLPSRGGCALLPLVQTQMIQVDAPGVRPEEMKAAARWRVKDLVQGRLDELTMDVMFVGDGKPRTNQQIFVAAARSDDIRELARRAKEAGVEVNVVDLAETAQRNLQSAMAEVGGLSERATGALVRHGEQCLLTICAGGELYYTRRLQWEGLAPPGQPAPAIEQQVDLASMDFVDYGAEPDLESARDGHVPQIVVELQRSLDLWERSWTDLPLAAVWVDVGEDSRALAALLQTTIGQPVGLLEPDHVFRGFEAAAASLEARRALLPLLGALLRSETRQP
jgi:MSHA biogenesis protein MshI